MKNYLKKAVFVLILAMVLVNLVPASSASAAIAPSLKYKSRVIYVGGSASGNYTNTCWIPSQNTEGYTVTYTVIKGGDLVRVADNGKVTATGNSIGTVVITVTYTNNSSVTVTEDFTVKVRRNSSDVRLINSVIKQVENVLTIGEEIELSSAKSVVGTSYKNGDYGLDNYIKLVSDQITYTVSNEEVIKIENRKLIAVGAGTATLTVVAYEYGDKAQIPVNTKDYTITVTDEEISDNMLVVYFSMPETTDSNNMTQEEENSVVVINGEVLGNTQYIAYIIEKNIGADIFRIEPETPYPTNHSILVDLAADEQAQDARPKLNALVENINQYDTIFLGYPNWWGDLPMILYTFLEEHDLSGKTIIPFNTHGGSGFSNTISTIKSLQPNATVERNGYTVSRNNAHEAESAVIIWLKELGFVTSE